MAATTAVLALAGTGSRVNAAGITASPAAPASAAAASTTSRRGKAARHRGSAVSTTQASVAPKSAITNVSAGVPPIAAHPLVGALAWLIASLPHGKPPHGQRSLSASSATHQPATATGQPGSVSSRRWATAPAARMTAEAPASPSQAYQATLSTHDSSGKKKATPNTSPTTNEARSDRPDSAIASSAGPAAASGQMPAGGNAAASASPPARPTTSAQRSVSGGFARCSAAGAAPAPAPASAWAG